MVVMIGVLFLAGRTDELGAAGAVALNVVAVVTAFGVATWMQVGRLPRDVRDAKPAYDRAAWSAAIWPLLFVSGFSYANREMGLLLVVSRYAAPSWSRSR
jgi:hypothetical protein